MRFLWLFWRTLKTLVAPVDCVGCGRSDVVLCSACRSLSHGRVHTTYFEDDLGIPLCPQWSLGKYEGKWRMTILAAKHDPKVDLSPLLHEAGRTLGAKCAEWVRPLRRELWVVPAPSSVERQRQGAQVVIHVAAGIVGELQKRRVSAQTVSALDWVSKRGITQIRGQSGRSHQQRIRGRLGTMKLVRQPAADTLAILVDDVSTTGATLREMMRVLPNPIVGVALLAHVAET